MKNKRIRDFMDRYPEFMLTLTVLAILSIVFSSTVSPYSGNNNADKIRAATTTATSGCFYRCTDSDGGSVYERGYISIVSPSGCPTTTMRHFQDYCIDETTLMEYDCDKENRYHTERQVTCECIDGACVPVKDYVDVSVTPSVKYVSVGDKAIYKIRIEDNHPLMRCITTDTDDSDTEEARCHIYYTYGLSVSGLPFTADYPREVRVYQGSSKTVELTILPEYWGRFTFTVTATQTIDRIVTTRYPNPATDSDSATLVVNGYTSCDETCRGESYEYGICRASCSSDERNIGTRHCIQQYAEPILVKKVEGVSTANVKAVAVNATAVGASSSGGSGDGGVAIAETGEVRVYRPTYCCCGVRKLKVKAWTNKNIYGKGETSKIYAKVAYTDESNVEAKVYGTVTKPDGSGEDITFRQVCIAQEIRKAVTDVEENSEDVDEIQEEIYCESGLCSPRCIYVANYENTGTEGRYAVTVHAETSGGEEAQTKTYFSVRDLHTTCNNYCQELGYEYGVCKMSCSDDEYDAGSKRCYQAIHPPLRCCCGRLTPPPPPPEKVKIHLDRGWNLITMPGKGELDKGTCEQMYGFVYIDGRYYTMKDAEEKLGEAGLKEYLRLHSFWIYTFKSCYLEFKLESYTSYSEIKLSDGWNFIPVTGDMVGVGLADIKGECELDRVYMWDSGKQMWDKLSVSYVFRQDDAFNGFIAYAEDSCGFIQHISLTPPPLPGGN